MLRFRKRPFNIPSAYIYAFVGAVARNIQFSTPYTQRLGAVLIVNHKRFLLVIHLLNQSAPFTVFRRIVTIIVDSFYRMPWRWPLAHIREEISKVIPSVADVYSAPTILSKFGVIRIITAISHSTPYTVFRNIRLSVFVPMFTQFLVTQTPATFRFTTAQGGSIGACESTTITHTQPENLSSLSCNRPQSNQSFKSLSCQVYETVIKRATEKLDIFYVIFTVVHRVIVTPIALWIRAVERFNLFQRPAFIIP